MKFNELSGMMQKPEPKPDTYEAGMALNQLLKIGTHAIKIHNMIDDRAEMEAWVAKKIDLASNYVKSVHGYTAGSKAGTYDDDGMSEMKRMPKGTGTMQGVKEDTYEEEPIHPLWGDWGTDPEDWSDTHVQNNEDIIIAIAKGKIPPRPPTISGYMDEQNDQWPEGVEGGKYNDDQIIDIISDTVGYDCRALGYDYLVKIRDGEVKGMYKPTPEQIKRAQEIVKDPEFAKARARNRGQAESVSEDAGEQALANEIGLFFVKKAKEMLQSMERPNKNDQEYEEYVDIAQAFKKGIQAGLDEVNMSDFEFSNNPFGDFGRGMDDGPDEEMVKILAKHGYQPGPDGANDKATIVRQRDESVSEDAGEGHMSKSQLYQTAKMAIELLDMIRKGDDLEGWVQTKLNLAADYLQAVYHYEDYQKLNPYREELDGSLMQRHAGIIQKHLDEILERKCRTEDVDTKPGMMRILKKRVNEVEKEIAKENRKETNESTIKPYISMYKGKDGKQVYDVLDKNSKSAYKTSDQRLAQHFFKKNYHKLREAELEEGIKEWGKRLAMAGIIVAGLAGVNSINNAIDNSVPAVKAMNTALELAQDSGNDELAKMIEKDLSDAKVRLSSGKDLSHVADMQDKYAKFMKTEGMAYESKLAINLKQRLK